MFIQHLCEVEPPVSPHRHPALFFYWSNPTERAWVAGMGPAVDPRRLPIQPSGVASLRIGGCAFDVTNVNFAASDTRGRVAFKDAFDVAVPVEALERGQPSGTTVDRMRPSASMVRPEVSR